MATYSGAVGTWSGASSATGLCRSLQEAIEDIKSKAFEQLSDETKDALRTAADFRRQLEESSHGVENVLQAPRCAAPSTSCVVW